MRRFLLLLFILLLFPLSSCERANDTNINTPLPSEEIGERNMNQILVNQVGYKKDSTKVASVRNINNTIKTFYLVNVETNQRVYEGTLTEQKMNESSNEMVSKADFSSYKVPGNYKIVIGALESYEFEIGDNVYNNLFTSVCDYLYSQRCGCNVNYQVFSHDACHTAKAKVYDEDTLIDVSGGWHDAGDYGKYIVPGAKTVEDLLLTYELYGDIYHYGVEGVSLSNLPDLLEEATYELDWMLKMQKSNGEVYHKISSYWFPDLDVMPDKDNLDMVVSPTSYAATADFSAVMAHASRVLTNLDSKRSALYKNASIKAMNALEKMEKVSYKNPTGISTGEYGDSNLNDEYLWALIELYKLTNDNKYLNTFDKEISKTAINYIAFGWDNMIGYAMYSYLRLGNKMTNYDKAMKSLSNAASYYINNMNTDMYGSPIKGTYYWGSNMSVCNAGMLLVLLDNLKNEHNNEVYFQSLLNYLLGNNSCDYSFVTGFGTNCSKNPHHRPSVSKNKAVPGMLVGGPNNDYKGNGGDTIASSLEGKVAPAQSYLDDLGAWSLNEVTIYWNSPFILLLASVMYD